MRLDDEDDKKPNDQEEEKKPDAEEKDEGEEKSDDDDEGDEKDEDQDGDGGKDEDDGKKTAAEDEEKKAESKLPPWMKKRLGDYTKKFHDQRRRADALEAENTSLKAAVEALSAGRGKDDEDDDAERSAEPAAKSNPRGKTDDQLVEERAAQIVASNDFNKACNELFDKGEAEYKEDWKEVMDNINSLGGFRENPTALSIIMELPDSHKIVHELGNDPELADRIFQLSPVKMTVELTKISDRLSKPKREKISEVPDPVKPLKNVRKTPSPELKDDEPVGDWMKKREAQLASKS